jgi:hypothetical protein
MDLLKLAGMLRERDRQVNDTEATVMVDVKSKSPATRKERDQRIDFIHREAKF